MATNYKPLLSIIIANYNKEKYLIDCFESILAQTYKNLEIIIIDDFSQDNSRTIINKFEEKNGLIIKRIYNSTNRGVASSRHAGIMAAAGEYITTLDSDDYYFDKKKLEREIETITYHKVKKGKDVVAFSSVVLVDENSNFLCEKVRPGTIKQGKVFKYILSRACDIPRDFIVKKSLYFRAGGYDPSLKIFEDWDLKIRLAAVCEYFFSNIKGTAYRQQDTGLSSSPYKILNNCLLKVFKKNFYLSSFDDRNFIKKNFREFRIKFFINYHKKKLKNFLNY